MRYAWDTAAQYAIGALHDKRGELTGQLDALQHQVRAAMIDLDYIDATVRMFDPEIEPDEIEPTSLPPWHHAFKGQVTRAFLAMLRSESAIDANNYTPHGRES